MAEFIAKDMKPVSVVEVKDFQKLFEILEPGYKIPSHKTMTKQLFDIQNRVAAGMKKELSAVDYI